MLTRIIRANRPILRLERLDPQTSGSRFLSAFACLALLISSMPPSGWAQLPPVHINSIAPQTFNKEQFDALLAPIALYPDELLSQVLMASTFPLEAVDAARWLETSSNRALQGDALIAALASKPWDPSVKSLLPFPQVLAMMNAHLDWLQQLGHMVATRQDEVMDSVQRLRRRAQAAGQLMTNEQQVVRTEAQGVVIAPAQPTTVYVPVYNPTVVYGTWPYPAYPPIYLPPPPGYLVGNALLGGLAFGAGVGITAGLWGWTRPDWGGRNVYVNVNRYNSINVNRPPITNPSWRAGGDYNRPGGGVRPTPGPVGRPVPPNRKVGNGAGRSGDPGARSSGMRPVQNGSSRPPQRRSGPAAVNRPDLAKPVPARGGGRIPATHPGIHGPQGRQRAPAQRPGAVHGNGSPRSATSRTDNRASGRQ
jgi:hypothetical protein